jgi:hypothetical protein
MAAASQQELIDKGTSLLDGIGRNSNLSGRQKASAMLDVGADMARMGIDPGISERLGGLRSSIGQSRLAKAQAAAFGQQVAAASGRPAGSEAANDSPLASLPSNSRATMNQRPEAQGVDGSVAAAIAAPPTPSVERPGIAEAPRLGATRPAMSNPGVSSEQDQRPVGLGVTKSIAAPPALGAPVARSEGVLSSAARAGAFRPESGGLTVQPGQAGGSITFNSGRRAGQTLEVDQPLYTGADGAPTTQHRGSLQHQQGLSDAQNIRNQLTNLQRLRLETDAFDPTITDPNVRDSARQHLGYMAAQAGREGEAYGRMLDNQGKALRLNSDGQMAGLQSQYLAETDPARREALAEKIRGVSGKSTAPAQANLQHVETDRGTMVFDPRTGRMTPAVGGDGQPVGSGKPLNEYQGKSTAFGMRAAESSRIIEEVGQGGKVQPSLVKRAAEAVPLIGEGLGMAANHLQSPQQQQIEQAQRDFINAVLRQESGAVISDAEFANARKQYFPVPGDSPEVVAQKQANRESAINGFRISAGPGARNIGGAAAQQQPQAQQQQQPSAAPKAGAVEDGYVFLGGSPNDPKNWVEVRK